ncbi:hypothetical protein V6N13_010355 [Hibiscus sabdariffa]
MTKKSVRISCKEYGGYGPNVRTCKGPVSDLNNEHPLLLKEELLDLHHQSWAEELQHQANFMGRIKAIFQGQNDLHH